MMPSVNRTLLLLLLAAGPLAAADSWQAGFGKIDISPTEPVPLAGYGGKTRLSERIDHPIWIKAMALRYGDGPPALLVTVDLVGLSERMVGEIAASALERHGVARERLVLNTSHNHSCPVTEDVLWLYYELSPPEAGESS